MTNQDNPHETMFRLAWLLKDIHHRRSNLAQMALNSISLHFGHPRILLTIDHMEGASQKELAERLRVTPASLATSLKRLEKAGFLERTIDERDSRINKIRLTAKGKEAAVACRMQLFSIDKLMLKGLDEVQQQQLAALLNHVNANLESLGLEDIQKVIDEEKRSHKSKHPR